jgi:hypothetical protein
MRRAHLRSGGNFRKANPHSRGKNNTASGLLCAFAHNMLAVFNGTVERYAVTLARSVLDHDHSVRAIRQRRPSHNLYAAISRNRNGRGIAGLKFADALQLRAGPRIGGSNRISIANRPIERRIIPIADNIMR